MRIPVEPYLAQTERWPAAGRHLLAHFDEQTIVVYQAYRPAVAAFAVRHQRFGGEWSFNRMSWIKPNFLWMMFRSGWGTKENQEATLAIHLRRDAFETILAQAVPSSFAPAAYASAAAWQAALAGSDVRLQWDPDHDPAGGKLERRAIQLGLRGAALRRFATEWIVAIEDISAFVAEQRQHAIRRTDYPNLLTPHEAIYQPADPAIRQRLGLEQVTPEP